MICVSDSASCSNGWQVLPNAFSLTAELRAAIVDKLQKRNRTLLFYYAPNALNESGGLSATGVSALYCTVLRRAAPRCAALALTPALFVHDIQLIGSSRRKSVTLLAVQSCAGRAITPSGQRLKLLQHREPHHCRMSSSSSSSHLLVKAIPAAKAPAAQTSVRPTRNPAALSNQIPNSIIVYPDRPRTKTQDSRCTILFGTLGELAGQHYEPTVSGNPGPPSGPSGILHTKIPPRHFVVFCRLKTDCFAKASSGQFPGLYSTIEEPVGLKTETGVLDPYYLLDESPDAAARDHGRCQVLARYTSLPEPGSRSQGRHSTSATGTPPPAAAVCSTQETHTTILSAAPFPAEALRRIALAAGVHLYLDTRETTRTTTGLPSTTCTGDGVEVAGSGLLVRAGHQAAIDQVTKRSF